VSRVIGAGISVPLRESAQFPTGVKEALARCVTPAQRRTPHDTSTA
jgi:hypothetical protein